MRIRTVLFALWCAALLAPELRAQASPRKIGELELTLGGLSATVNPAEPVIPKNIRSGVEIVVQSGGARLSAAQVAQFLGGPFEVRGVLSGPGLAEAVDVPEAGETASADPLLLLLPPLTVAGDYTLSSLRFLVHGNAVLDVTPGTVTVKVIDQVLVTSVQTRALTLAEIQAKGIVLDSSDVLGFDFTIGLQLSSQVVNITFPVVFDRQGVPIPQPIAPPPAPPRLDVPIPELPTIVPLLLKPDGGGELPQIRLPNGAMADVRIPSVLVIPGNVGFLKQFFSAQLYVANGAPGGSNLSVHQVTGTIKLPPGADHVLGTADDPLALPNTVNGPQPETLPVLGLGPDGTPTVEALDPGETGQAEFLIRGEKEGFHPIEFDIHATLEGLVTGPVGVTGSASGGVLVRNPFFDMSFTVPGIVRKGERFKVFATVTNISQALANNLTLNLDAASTSGARIEGSSSQSTPTLAPGDAKTFAFEFTSLRTGKVVASYLDFDTQDGSSGSLNFSLGVDDRGVPLSPDTLSLPAAVAALPGDVLEAAMRVLGQAWSVANAPAGTLPNGVIRTSKTVVTQKALALAEAGLRRELGQPAADALRDLVTDFWGGSPLDPGFDQLLRTSDAGHDFAAVLGAALADPMQAAGGAVSYHGDVSDVAISGPDFVAVAVGDGAGAAPVSISLTDGNGNLLTSQTPGGMVPGGVLLPLGFGGATPWLGLVTAPAVPPYTLLLTGHGTGEVDLAVTLPRGDGSFLRTTISGVSVTPTARLQLALDPAQAGVLEVDADGDGTFEATRTLAQEVLRSDGPRLLSANVIGPETLSQAGPFGLNAVLLFDRIVTAATARTPGNYAIPANAVRSAGPQMSGRLVFANLAQPEGPYVPSSLAAQGIADQRGVVGPAATVPLHSRLQDPGAVVSGRVFNADGSPAGAATVTYVGMPYDPNCSDPFREPVGLAATPLGGDGRYQFRYVRQDNCGAPFTVSTKDPATGALRQVTSYVRSAGQQLVLDIALFGRGSVAGTVRDLGGNPVPGATVTAVSGTDPQVGGQSTTDGDGRYVINGITVGPVNVTASKGGSLGHSAGRIDLAGTTATVDVTLDGGSVKVRGTVQKVENGVASPLPGATVIYYLRDAVGNRTAAGFTQSAADGSYALSGLPTGPFVVVAQINTRDRTESLGVAAAGDDLTVPLVITIQTNFGTVNGTVTLPGGAPAPGVLVSLGADGVLSNADGTYQLTGVPVLPSVGQTVRAQTLDGLRSGQTTVIVNTPNQVVNGANVTLSGLATAQFTVLDATGQPLPGMEVRLATGFCLDPCGCLAATTDGQGRATFPGLALGTVTGRAFKVAGSFIDLAVGTASLTTDGATGFGILRFPGSGTVRGTVVDADDAAVLGADISLSSNVFDPDSCTLSQRLSQRVQTDVNGQFQFQRVNVGRVNVTASQAFFPAPVGAQGTLAQNGDVLTFSLKLVNTISGVLSGTVYRPDGVTPAGPGVEVTANGPLPDVTVATDAAGFYKFAKIFPQGLYTLTASDPVSGAVFRTQVFLRAGEDAALDLRLKGTGTVRVHVVDGAGQPVGSAFVKLQETEYPNETFDGALTPSDQGTLVFEEVFEGGLSVQVTDTFGRGGRASGVLPAGTAEVEVTVQLTTTGTVRGHFYRADGTTPIALGVVELIVNGRTLGQATTESSGDPGAYAFDFVPAGPVRLEAQDPLTARTGVAAGQIDEQDQVLDLDVVAQGIGTVQGLVTSDGAPQPGAHVKIVSGTFSASTFADSTGSYLLSGVPEGRVVVTADLGNGFLSGTNAATLAGDGTTLTLDVALRGAGSVLGLVVAANGVTPAPLSAVSIQVGGTGGGTLDTTSDAAGSFFFPRVPAGVGTLSARVLGDIDVGKATVTVPAGESVEATVQLNGTGGLSGLALDSAGQPVAGTIQLTGTGAFPYSFTLTAGADGRFTLPKVLAGPFTAKLRVTGGGFTLFGSASGTIVPGETFELSVQLQDSGTVTGLVLRPDGVTPAVGANVAVQLAAGGTITVQVQNDGRFTATGVPLGAFTVRINDPLTAGLGLVQGRSITQNGEVVDVGTVTLDDQALTVLAVDPPDGAVNVDVHQVVTVTFSDVLQGTAGVFLTRSTGGFMPSTAQLAADGKSVTLTGTWPDGATLLVNVTAQVTDLFGRPLAQPQVTRFTTVDLTPPSVVAIAPANQAIQVSADAVVVVTFSEPLSATAPLAGVVALAPAGGAPVEGSTESTSPNVVTFTPAAPLTGDTRYTVLVNGATDLAGNVQAAAFTSTFATTDTVAPTLHLNSPADGAIVKTAQPAISISLADALSGVDPTTAVLRLDAQAVAASASASALLFTPSTPLAEGGHAIAASVKDRAGNEGTLAASFVVDTQPPSVAVLAGITAGQVLSGEVAVTAAATDDGAGVARIDLLVDGVKRATFLPPDFSVLFDTNTLTDGSHLFTVQAVDAAGNAGPASEPVQAFVENDALTVTITAPPANSLAKGQVVVTAVASEPVARIEFSLDAQTVTVTTPPYQATLSLAGITDGPRTITATAFNFVGDSATATRTILVQQTPPPAPNAALIFAEPPVNGASLVHGLPGAVRGGLTVTVTHTVSGAQATALAAADGSFAANVAAAVDDLLSLVASDAVGNVSAATLITVRRTPSLPPATGSTSLHYEGNLADRVSLTAGNLTPDGAMDAVFTLSLSIGEGITRLLTFIDLQSSSGALRSTRSGQIPLGVAADAGAPLQNNATGQVSFSITSGATLTLFAGDDGFIAPGSTYTATAAFADGSRFVGTFTLVPPADRTQVAHSATLTASPPTVAIGTSPGTTTLTVRDIRDIDGSLVPDGAKIALSAANMASRNPAGTAVTSAGGTIVDGEPAANNADFKVFTVTGGEVTATYSSDPVTPAPILGALAVVQMQAADADGNVLGTEAVATIDLNLRAATDRALVHPVPAVLYGDGADRRSHFTVEVRDALGNPVPDGTPVLVSAANCAAVNPQGGCIGSIGGQVLGGQNAAAGSNYRLFIVAGGVIEGDYSAGTLTAGNLKTRAATLQVLAATPTGGVASSSALGTATITLAGAGSVELTTVPSSVPYVFPVVPVQVFGHHAHDIRGNLVPDGANLLLSAANCATLTQAGGCIGSIGGTLLDGAPSPSGSNYRVFPLTLGEIVATYSTQGAAAPATGQTRIANLQAVMGDAGGRLIDSTGIGLVPLQVLGPSNAIGTAEPATIFADGASHTSTVTFNSLLDAVGNPLPEGSSVVVSASNCAGLTAAGSCILSVGGQILNGATSPSGSHLKVLTVEDGEVTATYADQGITATPGQLRTANVVVLPANAGGAILSSIALGAVPVSLAGLTSATGAASPGFVFADGSDQRTTVTLTDFKDAAGQPIPDGTIVAVSAGNCFSVTPQGSCNLSAGGQIMGTNTAPFNSTARLFTITNGQVVFEYSSQGVAVASGQRTATVQAVPVTPQGNQISSIGLVAVPIQLLAQGSAAVAITPVDLFADGRDFRSQVVVSGLVQADGVTPVPDGTKVGLTAGNCTSVLPTGSCVLSAGGAIFAAGTTPGDGTVAPNNSSFKVFTVAGGEVLAVYSDAGVVSQFNQTRTASVAVVPASSTGSILTIVALGFGTVQLRGMASTTASGPATLSLSGTTTTGTVTFSAIKDTAGNTVPDGSVVVVALGNCTTVNTSGSCNLSTGGTIVDGSPSPSGSQFKAFTVSNGTVTVTYSTAGATAGTARVQLLPGTPDGSRLGSTTLAGGVWAINVTN